MPTLAAFLFLREFGHALLKQNSWEAANQARVCTSPNEKPGGLADWLPVRIMPRPLGDQGLWLSSRVASITPGRIVKVRKNFKKPPDAK